MIRRAFVAAVAAALLAAPAAYAVEQSSVISESLTVQAQLTMTGVPASIAYGTGLAGDTLSSGFTVVITTNNPTGYHFDVAASDFAGGGGIASTQRRFLVDNGACDPSQAVLGCWISPTWRSGGSNAYGGPAGTRVVLANNETTAADTYGMTLRVVLPSGATPGAYTGSATFYATTN